MAEDLGRLKFVRSADVYKAGVLAGHLNRTVRGSVVFAYRPDFFATGGRAVATTLPFTADPLEAPGGAVPSFFSGLLPEGHRLTVLKDAVKTSLGDELSLLLAVGADVPGDVQIVPAGEVPLEPRPLADTSHPEDLDFASLTEAVDRHGLPGVQSKASASMLTMPLALANRRYLLKLDPPQHPHLVLNEAAHLAGAKVLKIPVARHSVVQDRNGLHGLLVERFDRTRGDGLLRLALEDGAQVLNLPPASKYAVSSEAVVLALAGLCKAKAIAVRNLYLQFVFAWLTGNGDLHAKNVSVLEGLNGGWVVAPVYDIPCTLLYGDDTMALAVAGRVKNLKARHWQEFAASIGLPERAAAAANKTALTAVSTIGLDTLPFTGSPLNGTLRELRFRRAELTGLPR
ncbi:HipA domain-containing protein [Pseudarthrobacter sp. AL07]|uniref:type II toxin-antitoxin system HipA family toxin n=1 Tax=unclassified Pseudarthrobacter TaxID=2647000 RepID=UPI00249C7E95|nr:MULTISPECIES: HipA domain-containing protein [unclassified Pseudarthrobacter]MDI3195691.1 HipA domain-containing protein [Pseudarthrobacter sp. AL20]MDI3209760.1 HipA domain-containing protein [Pseudarthrobacter sp. AL07]